MKIEFDFTLDDWLNYSVFHAKQDNSTQKIKKRFLILYPILFFILGILILSIDKKLPELGFILIFLGIVYFFIGKKMDGSAYRKAMKKMILDGDNSEIICKHNMIIDESGIIQKLPNSEKRVNWKGIKKVEENEIYYFLYENSIAAYIIPKSAIKDLYEFDSLVSKMMSNY